MTVNVCAYVYARLSKHFAAQAPIQAALYLPRTALITNCSGLCVCAFEHGFDGR